MAKWDRLGPRVFDRALDLARDVLGPGPEARIFVDNFFRRYNAQLLAIHNAYDAGELVDEAFRELIEDLVPPTDALLAIVVGLTRAQAENFRRRLINRLVEGLAGEDDEDPGPLVVR